jgi:hypothetical protein
MTATLQPTAQELWGLIKKEITGIQLVWEVVNRLYFQPLGKGWSSLNQDAPLLFGLTQTVYIESLLMRVARLMDPALSGKGSGQKHNLSLKRLMALAPSIGAKEEAVRNIWDGSALKSVRDKYLSHNDLNRLLVEEHTLNIPLEIADVKALRQLVEGLLESLQTVNSKLTGASYVHDGLSIQVQFEVNRLENTLLGGHQFFSLLPEHDCLQQAWREVGHD